MIPLKCETCGKSFQRTKSKYNYNLKRGTKHQYCSVECNPYVQELDEYSYFRYLIGNTHKNGQEVTIDEKYLKDIYERQDGKCAVTGITMIPKLFSHKGKKLPYQMSVDRLDNSKGYIPGNVRLTTLMANIAKNVFTDEDILDFCKNVTLNKLHDEEIMEIMWDRMVKKTFTITT